MFVFVTRKNALRAFHARVPNKVMFYQANSKSSKDLFQ